MIKNFIPYYNTMDILTNFENFLSRKNKIDVCNNLIIENTTDYYFSIAAEFIDLIPKYIVCRQSKDWKVKTKSNEKV